MALVHYTSDGHCISFPLMYYVDSLVMRTQLIRWSEILLQQFCFSLDLYRSYVNGRLHFPFASELYTMFFGSFHSTRPTLVRNLPPRPMNDAHMHMRGKLVSKRV